MTDPEAVHFHSTPLLVAERMATLLYRSLDSPPDPVRILDPGIGEGCLASAVAKVLVEAGKTAKITGTDISTRLLRMAESRLEAEGVEAQLRKEDFLREFSGNGFDAVICNPPYGKRSQADLGERLLLEYRDAISGHPNLFALFIHKIIRSLRDGGVCVVICPKSLMSGPYFTRLRKFMIERGAIENLLLFDQRSGLFDGVLQGVFVFQFRKGVQQGECTVHRIRGEDVEDRWIVDSPFATERLGYRIIPGSSASNRRLLLSALNYKESVGDHFHVETGPLVWFRHKTRLVGNGSAGSIPIIWSDQVEHGHITPGRRSDRVRLTGINKFALAQSKLGPALVTKRVTAPEEDRRLVAGLIPPPLWDQPVIYENHTNVVRTKTGPARELIRLELLLATRLYDDLLRAISHNTQVGAADLRMLPLVGIQLTEAERLAAVKAAEAGMSLLELVDLASIGERLLQVLSAADFSDPEIGSEGDVVHLALPLSEATGRPIDRRKPVDV